jgi:UDP-glucose 4-epimerase
VKILITGGAGFIGSHLAETCLKRGDEVYIIDDLSTGSIGNIRFLQKNPAYASRLFFLHDTILNYEPMVELVGICDVVVHLAAAVGVQFIIDNPLSSIITNVRGTEIVLELCAKFKKKVLVASTSEVYGKHNHAPLVETDDCVYGPSDKCRWSYAAGKLMDEFTALAYHRTRGLPVTIVRLFNTVGPRQTGRYGMVVPRLVGQALKGDALTVYGDGSQSRTFTHVKEVVEAITGLIQTSKALGQVVNIGGTEEISILDLANRIIRMTQSSSSVEMVPYDVAYPRDFEDMQRRVPSTAKLQQLVGFAPKLGLDAILHDIIEDLRRRTETEPEETIEMPPAPLTSHVNRPEIRNYV